MAAAARSVVLHAPDRAEYRAVAAEAAVSLIAAMTEADRNAFMTFVSSLSRTPKVASLSRV